MKVFFALLLLAILPLVSCPSNNGTGELYVAGKIDISVVPARVAVCFYSVEDEIQINTDGVITSAKIALVGNVVFNDIYGGNYTSYRIVFPDEPSAKESIDGICAWIETDNDNLPGISFEVVKVPEKVVENELSFIVSITYDADFSSYIVSYRTHSGVEGKTYLSLIGSTGFDFGF